MEADISKFDTPNRPPPTEAADAPDGHRRIARSISPIYLRLALLLAAALLPAVTYSIFAAYTGYRENQTRTRETIVRSGELAADRAHLLIESTRRLLAALAVMEFAPTSAETRDLCTDRFTHMVEVFPEYTAFAITDASGRVICSSNADGVDIDVSDRPWFQQVRMTRTTTVSQLIFSKLTHKPVVVVAVPLGAQGEPFHGAISVGIDVLWFAGLYVASIGPSEGTALLIDRSGMVVTGTGQLIDTANLATIRDSANLAALPDNADIRSAIDRGSRAFSGKGRDGADRLYSVTNLSGSDLFVIVSVLESGSIGWARRDFIGRLLAATAMVLCALFAVAVGGDLLVARELRALAVTAQALQSGDYSARPKIKGGSREVRQLADTLTSLAERVQRHDREMSSAVAQKDAMLREIHHRVKNNLQVVTSLMSIQANRLSDGASKRAMAELQRRVRALGLLHRYLYEGDDLRYLDFGKFTAELCQMVKESSGPAAQAVTIAIDVPSIAISADRAVPLGLLITEALSNAFKHAFPQGQAGVIRIALSLTPERKATVTISDNGVGSAQPSSANGANSGPMSGTGTLLMHAFAEQLGGTFSTDGSSGVKVKFSFDLADTGDGTAV